MITFKILGTGCPKCKLLETTVHQAVQQLGIEAEIIKVTEIADIMQYNIMSTPGLVIDEKVVSYGTVNEVDEIISFLHAGNVSRNDTPPQKTPYKCSEEGCC